MIRPINNHLLIEPLKHESFIPSEKGIYEEVGIVIDAGEMPVKKGDRVFFDAWLAGKYPKNEKEWFWLVNWNDVRAVENEDKIPE